LDPQILMAEVLVISRDRVGPQMAGPGVRAAELARVLAARHRVRLAAPYGSAPIDDSVTDFVEFDRARGATLRDPIEAAEVIFSDALGPSFARRIGDGRRRWIVDLYNPEPFEGLEVYRFSRGRLHRRAQDVLRTDRLLLAARVGSAFVCANERQRDMWLGFLAAERRLGSARHDSDPGGRNLLEIVPFGVPEAPPEPGPPLLRGRLFADDARILLWSGGLWDWLDPLTVLRALAILRRSDQRWVCAFVGTVRPVGGEHFTMVDRTRRLAAELGLLEAGAVRFIDWVPYEERGAPLTEADVAVCAHFPTMETRFAVRTRLVDAVWAGLPIVSTDGDHFADLIRTRGLGETAPPEEPQMLAHAVERVVETGKGRYSDALRELAEELRWPRAARPLARLVERSGDLPAARRVALGNQLLVARNAAAQQADRARRWLTRG
jgi:glycosyltransferase involved in cell wall biosynthesis